jgi:hypothetical protein
LQGERLQRWQCALAEDPVCLGDRGVALCGVGGGGAAEVLVVLDLDGEEAAAAVAVVGDEDVEGGPVAGVEGVAAAEGPLDHSEPAPFDRTRRLADSVRR